MAVPVDVHGSGPPRTECCRRSGRAAAASGPHRWPAQTSPLTLLPPGQVVLHDLASADARDIPRAACFESRAPTALAFLLLNLPGLTGYSASGSAAQAKVRATRSCTLSAGQQHTAPHGMVCPV